ncbi:MAG: T9SS type A sorting domain-containing protein [Lentimicrobium sp.]
MKKLTLFILGVAFSHSLAFSQACLPEGITFYTQVQIDSFQANYPGCTEIEGNVNIIDDDYWSGIDITNLNGLSVITSIGGSLDIRCAILPSLAGLNALTFIGGNLSLGGYNMNGGISGNPVLTSLEGLEGLTFIGGGLNIRGNGSLTTLSGLDNVAASSINNITIHDNIALSACNIQSLCEYLADPNGTVDIYKNATGCNSPADIGDACGITMPCLPYGNYYFFSQADVDNFQTDYPGCSDLQGNVSITGDDIVDLSGFSGVSAISGDLNIGRYYYRTPYGNPMLTSLTGFENLNQIGGTLLIISNDTLASLSGLENLSTIGNDLLIGIVYAFPARNMEALTSIQALGSLTSIGGELYISGTSLTDLTGLDSLSSIGGNITIYSNSYLSDISSLAMLTSITGRLGIAYTAIGSMNGLNNVTTITGSVYINHNHSLKNLEGLDNLSYIGTAAWIFDNDSLLTMEGLNNLEMIGGYLDIWGNPSLSGLSGLENLDTIGSYLHISQNGLTGLSALSGLQSIKENLYIINNDHLTSLSGLDNVFTDSISELKIFGNALLQTCDVQSICDYLADSYGIAEIYDNAPGCSSPEEVESACDEVSAESICLGGEFLLFPNPAGKTVTISGNNATAIREMVIYNQTGQKVLLGKPLNNTLDISKLRPGMYFVELVTNQRKVREKLMVE